MSVKSINKGHMNEKNLKTKTKQTISRFKGEL